MQRYDIRVEYKKTNVMWYKCYGKTNPHYYAIDDELELHSLCIHTIFTTRDVTVLHRTAKRSYIRSEQIIYSSKEIINSSVPKQLFTGSHHTSLDLGSLFEKKRSVMSTSVSVRAEMNGMDGEIEFQEKNTNTKSGEITRPPRRWCTCLYPLLLFIALLKGSCFPLNLTCFA